MNVIFTRASLRDLDGIRRYITKESGSFEVADRFMGRIYYACETLDHSAESSNAYRYAAKWRMKPFENYLIIFRVVKGEVNIGRVRHSKRRAFRG